VRWFDVFGISLRYSDLDFVMGVGGWRPLIVKKRTQLREDQKVAGAIVFYLIFHVHDLASACTSLL
jgi:hypothetical protein